ncbi:Ig mu chain C region [Striga asiatica]|uniref:Ig mu chain C region n=1 Tax=Striga asiatica TaxID=4170 RepID=A0A5A7Q967_STRAF|nr:Ig mu chain C region [Striga asiatica]
MPEQVSHSQLPDFAHNNTTKPNHTKLHSPAIFLIPKTRITFSLEEFVGNAKEKRFRLKTEKRAEVRRDLGIVQGENSKRDDLGCKKAAEPKQCFSCREAIVVESSTIESGNQKQTDSILGLDGCLTALSPSLSHFWGVDLDIEKESDLSFCIWYVALLYSSDSSDALWSGYQFVIFELRVPDRVRPGISFSID